MNRWLVFRVSADELVQIGFFKRLIATLIALSIELLFNLFQCCYGSLG